jgi:hypothetical protein
LPSLSSGEVSEVRENDRPGISAHSARLAVDGRWDCHMTGDYHRCSGFFHISLSNNNLFIRISDVSLFL